MDWVRPDDRFRRWVGLSVAVHILSLVLLSIARSSVPALPLEASVVRVNLVAGPAPAAGPAPTPAPPAAAAMAAAPRPIPLPAEKVPVPKPATRPETVRRPSPPPAVQSLQPRSAPLPRPEATAATESAATAAVSAPGATAAVASLGPPPVSAGPAGSGSPGVGSPGSGTPGGDPIRAYAALVRQRIDAHKRYPAMARRRGLEGIVTVRIRIAEDGSVERSVALGEVPRLFEKPALEAVQKAAPFPPPPPDFGELELAIRYELEE